MAVVISARLFAERADALGVVIPARLFAERADAVGVVLACACLADWADALGVVVTAELVFIGHASILAPPDRQAHLTVRALRLLATVVSQDLEVERIDDEPVSVRIGE